MRNKTMPRLLAAFLALLLCMGAFSVTAFAYGGETETDGSMAPYDPEPGAAEMKDTEAASDTEWGWDREACIRAIEAAGLDNDAFTQLENGATVEVIGEDGDWIKVLLPERVGYVHSDYLTVTEGAASDGAASPSLSGRMTFPPCWSCSWVEAAPP